MKKAAIVICLVASFVFAQTAKHVPSVDELLLIDTVGGTQISPDGRWVAYTVNSTDFKQDSYPTQIWLANAATSETLRITNAPKSSTMPKWSPDSNWLAFLSDRTADKNQVYAIRPTGGEALQMTKSETSISDFAWSPNGKTIAYVAPDAPTQAQKDREDRYAKYEVVRNDYTHSHIWTIELADAIPGPAAGKQHTSGKDFTVNSMSWSPDSTRIAFAAQLNPDLTKGDTSDIYLLTVSDNAVRKIVSLPMADGNPQWSPDGKSIVFNSYLGNKTFGINQRLAILQVDGVAPPRSISEDFDENPSFVAWNSNGIYFSGSQKTATHLFRVNPGTAKITRATSPDNLLSGSYSLSSDGRTMAFTSGSPASLSEVHISSVQGFSPKALTKMTDQVKNFTLASREVISWNSRDGETIEGILYKPSNFDPTKKYPLLCIIHGGPTGIDRPALLAGDTRTYPADIWVARGALVLKVNYRGSAGYGEAFRRLNIKNLGVGDAWDVISGVDNLIAKGWVEPKKVACMGWSQGGYISAFLTASSDRFAAISVGAGISDWATYYYNTDITQFTLNYLGDDPVDDPAIYSKTSPIAYIKNAKTPTLIQHGDLDKRVPIPNGYELRQALEDRGVKVEMLVYKGFGHNINKPKSMRAVMEHNLAWFNHYIFGDSAPDFTKSAASPSLPER